MAHRKPRTALLAADAWPGTPGASRGCISRCSQGSWLATPTLPSRGNSCTRSPPRYLRSNSARKHRRGATDDSGSTICLQLLSPSFFASVFLARACGGVFEALRPSDPAPVVALERNGERTGPSALPRGTFTVKRGTVRGSPCLAAAWSRDNPQRHVALRRAPSFRRRHAGWPRSPRTPRDPYRRHGDHPE